MKKFYQKYKSKIRETLLFDLACRVVCLVRNLIWVFGNFAKQIFATIKTHRFEKKLGIRTHANYAYKDTASRYKDAVLYEPLPYDKLAKIVDYLKLKPEDTFVDLGCGKGRVLFYIALQNIRKIIGVELNEELIGSARENLANFKFNKAAIELLHRDAVNFEFKDENIIFMVHPFGRQTFETVLGNIKTSLVNYPRQIRIVYAAAQYKKSVEMQDWLIMEKQLFKEFHGGCYVWRNKI